jgi:hypothetical protein
MEKPKSSLRKTRQSATWIDPGSNPDFCGKNLTTNGLRYEATTKDSCGVYMMATS